MVVRVDCNILRGNSAVNTDKYKAMWLIVIKNRGRAKLEVKFPSSGYLLIQ